MIKSTRDLEWDKYLTEEDLELANELILSSVWYPLETYKRMGLAVFKLLAKGNLEAAWGWGRASVEEQTKTYKTIIQENNPIGTLRRFSGIQRQFVDFEFIDINELGPGKVQIVFKMVLGDEADEAYAHHLGGVLEGLVELSGAESVKVDINEKCWEGSENTVFEIEWKND
jgi:uncharacterized protein (TIGR02265 family)